MGGSTGTSRGYMVGKRWGAVTSSSTPPPSKSPIVSTGTRGAVGVSSGRRKCSRGKPGTMIPKGGGACRASHSFHLQARLSTISLCSCTQGHHHRGEDIQFSRKDGTVCAITIVACPIGPVVRPPVEDQGGVTHFPSISGAPPTLPVWRG